jgi:hypothetical protein
MSCADALNVSEHAAGAASWTPPVTLADAGLEAFAVSPNGAAAAVWERYLGGGFSTPSRDRLYLSVKPPGQTRWRSPIYLGRSGYQPLQGDGYIFLPQPQVAINAAATVFVAWQWPHKHQFYPRVALVTAASNWRLTTSVVMPRPGTNPVIAGDDQGSATLLWDGPRFSLLEAALTPSGHVLWTHALAPQGDSHPVLAADGRGDVVGEWGRAALRPAHRRAWCPSITTPAAEDDWGAAISPTGLGMVVWEHIRSPVRSAGDAIQARTLTACRNG